MSFSRQILVGLLAGVALGLFLGELAATREYAPEAEVVVLQSEETLFQFLEGRGADFDALVMPAERGAIWSLRHPHLSVVVPDPPIMTIPLAYVIGERDERLRLFLNTWIDLLKRDGTVDELRDYWVYGRNAETRRPRWSIIRNVLGWVE